MNCPRCNEKMKIKDDYDCEDLGCECGNGNVTYYKCKACRVSVELTTDCNFFKNKEEDE